MGVARHIHRAAAGCYLALFALLAAWLLWLDPPPDPLVSVAAAVLLAPLLVPVRGVLAGRRYTLAWSTMFILLYFLHGVATAAGPPPGRWLGLAEASLSVAYFVLALVYVRLTRARSVADADPSGENASDSGG
ncbi:DUF2069 domain-containing protein [Ectothiorhodospiraceae bacterium WFHF3C12]|nr:DUF2069 domain-containing protein [Ectothiorhodospiraceae bacterium WFHF3C12]